MDLPEPVRGAHPRATFGQRAAALLVDFVVVWIATFVLGRGSLAVGIFVFLVAPIGYFGILEGSESGQTLGKRLVRIRVVDFETGDAISYARGFARAAVKWLISAEFLFGLGFWWMLWDRDRQTWHDKIASTTVVGVVAAQPDQWRP